MTKKTHLKQKNKSASVVALILAFAVFTAVFVFGLIKLGIINLDNTDDTDSAEVHQQQNAPAANISNDYKAPEYYEAIPREEYASALAKMSFPDDYYRNYKIAIMSSENISTTEYFVVKDFDNWWVQTENNDIIMRTAICESGSVTITDNTSNTSVITDERSNETPYGASFEEECGMISLRTLVNMIHDAANGNTITYGGGIADYSLSFTQTRLSGENLFSFSFVCQNGVSEEYTFSFENAVILSASKSYEGKEIFKMEIKDYRNDLTEIDVSSLISAK